MTYSRFIVRRAMHSVVLLSAIACISAGTLGGQQPVTRSLSSMDARGAWKMGDGGIVALYPTDASDTAWRFVDFKSGASHRLYRRDSMTFTSSGAWTGTTPVRNTYSLSIDSKGRARELAIFRVGAKARHGTRVPVVEDTATFMSGSTKLFGKLTRPAGARRIPVVVFVHGSDETPSVDRMWDPYLFAANGVAMFVFDKRGTGRSGGTYTQMFSLLADDVVAATRWLKSQPSVDTTHIGVVGFSQGGWVAPLAASKEPGIRFMLVAYGMTMSVANEDKMEAPLKLRERGFSDADISEFEDLNAAIHRAAERGFADGWGEIEAKMTQYRDKPWMKALPTMQTWAGSVAQMGVEQAKLVVPNMFKTYIDPFYESVPILERLDIPILWLIAGDDIEAPPGPTIDALAKLRKDGRNIETRIFPHTDHGITEFTQSGSRRTRTRYAPDYFPTIVTWIVKQASR